jgi:hypothetical protein
MKVLCAIVVGLGATAQAWAGEPTPAGVAMSFYLLANQGRCVEAEQLFTSDAVAVIKKTLGGARGFALFCADKGSKSALVALEVQKEAVAAGRATVEIKRTYKEGLAFETDSLVKVCSSWKLVVGENQVVSNGAK